MKAKASAKGKTNPISTSEVIIERNDGLLGEELKLLVNSSLLMEKLWKDLLDNLKELVTDHVQNEGEGVEFWENIDANNLVRELQEVAIYA